MPESPISRDADAEVRCLSYLMRRISQLMPIPEGVFFELIPAQYLGGPYPCIGLYTHRFVDTDQSLCRLSFVIGGRLEQFVQDIGIERLLVLSAEEDVCWKDVLEPYREALEKCRMVL